ncbi:MAG: hypothetical protein R6W86_01040 [Marinobacter sp.]|uniref:hypothetical protein n=1 Tax=Marinobacter sp. TaxID=50741 RepID=UPI00396DD0DD
MALTAISRRQENARLFPVFDLLCQRLQNNIFVRNNIAVFASAVTDKKNSEREK